MTHDLHIVVLAAGKSTRMKSARPKVLHDLAGRMLIEHVLHTTKHLGATSTTLVIGHAADDVKHKITRLPLSVNPQNVFGPREFRKLIQGEVVGVEHSLGDDLDVFGPSHSIVTKLEKRSLKYYNILKGQYNEQTNRQRPRA